jgi:hypothetical protein
MSSTAIACATGGFKGVFLHGVLSAFETAGFRADAYAAASSSVIPAAGAAAGRANDLGLQFWEEGRQLIQEPGLGMSQMVLTGIEKAGPLVRRHLFQPKSPRFLIAANAVDQAGAEETQSKGARRRGRRLLLAAARGDRRWVESHLTLHIFDTGAQDNSFCLTAGNFDEVAYASSRMLHAWDIPATIEGRPYVDAYYTCACPALKVAELGFEQVIAISTEPSLYRDIFQIETMPDEWHGVPIWTISPDSDPAEIGVTYTMAAKEGLQSVYEHGQQKGQEFCIKFAGMGQILFGP